MAGLKKKIESIIRERADNVEPSDLASFQIVRWSGEPDEYLFDEDEAFEVAKDELISDLESHDIEWATNIYYPLKDESRLKKEIISFIENLDY